MGEVLAVASAIEKVEVFRSQALITRRGKFQAPVKGGAVVVLLPGLPLFLDDSSVRARLLEMGRSRIVDLHLELDLGERKGAQRTAGEERLLAGERQRAGLLLERQRWQEHIQFLLSLSVAQHAVEDLPERLAFEPRWPTKSALELAAFAHPELIAAQERLRELDRQLREKDDQLAAARDELRRESQADKARLKVCRKAARLLVECEQAGRGELVEISYLVPAARWFPQYELRVASDREAAELVLMALVAQKSGEDWPRAELSLSTADLARSAELPELDSWRIGKAQPPRPSGWRELPDTLGELFEGYDRGLRQLPPPPLHRAVDLPSAPTLVSPGKRAAKDDDGFAANLLQDIVATQMKMPRGEPVKAEAPEEVQLEEEADDKSVLRTREMPAAEMVMDAPVPCSVMEPPPPPRSRPGAMPPQALAAPKPVARKQLARESKRAKAAPAGEAYEEEAQSFRLAGALGEDRLEASAIMDDGVEFGGGGGAGTVEEAAVRIAAGEEALAYQQLRMVPADDREARGQLRAAGPAERLAEQLAELSPQSAAAIRSLSPDALLRLLGAKPARLAKLSPPMHTVPVSTSAGHFAVRYLADSPAEVRADGQLHSLTLLRRQGAVRKVFRCVPALDKQVYQLAIFQNPLQLPLLAGPVKVYREGDFVVDAPLETTPPGKPITVNLGVEPSIAIARNTRFAETTEGLLGGATVLTHTVEIEVNSKLLSPSRLEVFERVPVSFEDELKVTLQSSAPKAEPYDQADRGSPIHGGYRFTLDLAPKEKKNCTLVYRIVIPSKRTLVGGNRRD